MMRNGAVILSEILLLSTLLAVVLWGAPAAAQVCEDVCIGCHGNPEDVHGDFSHAAAPGGGSVALFPDNGHDNAGWVGDKPYFDVFVDCSMCHNTELTAVHGYNCATCHPTPYDTLGIWGKGCSQGGCHAFYHQDAFTAHAPFANPYDPGNDCSRCHQSWHVPQTACLGCHAAFDPADVTPPVTTIPNLQAEYVGPARLAFSVKENGKVSVGRTFYKLDNGPEKAAGKDLLVTAPGSHTLDFWSRDQSGRDTETEPAINRATFTIIADTSPPTTTSNAQATYNQVGGTITLTATDNGTLGVKATYYSLNGGPNLEGNSVVIPAVNGMIAYTLTFWSEDWAGNVESPKTVNFTVNSGTGTLRLVWGDSDMSGSPCPNDPEANAAWIVRKNSWTGPVVATGYRGCPNWSGVEDLAVPVGSTYFVKVDWWDSYWGVDEQTAFPNVSVMTPGQVVRLGY